MQTLLTYQDTPLQEGMRLGPYRLARRLQQSGMSTVYRGYHLEMREPVAMKVVDGRYANLDSFYREIQLLRSIRHPHIISYLDNGECSGYHYLVMPYLCNGTLEDLIQERPLSLEEADYVLERLADALTHIHGLDLLHRDIKPSNILFDSSYHLRLADFGIASFLGEPVIQNDRIMGTPHYMAPELFDGYVDARSEVYSVGILLYQSLTGRLPFDGPSYWSICVGHKEEQPVEPSFHNPDIPRAIEHVVLRALEKDPCDRFQSVVEMSVAYKEALVAPATLLDQVSSALQTARERVSENLSQISRLWSPPTMSQEQPLRTC